jgi:hypothetical protein
VDDIIRNEDKKPETTLKCHSSENGNPYLDRDKKAGTEHPLNRDRETYDGLTYEFLSENGYL